MLWVVSSELQGWRGGVSSEEQPRPLPDLVTGHRNSTPSRALEGKPSP